MLKAIYILLLIFLVGFYSVAPQDMDKTTMAFLLIIVLFSLILFASRKEKNLNLKGQYLKHSTIALAGIVIVFFQYPLDYVLGNISGSNLFIWINKSIVVKSLILSVIGFLCFLLGYLSYRKRFRKAIRKEERPSGTRFLLLLAAILLGVYFLTVNPLYLVGYYGKVEMGSMATYAILFFEIVVFAIVIQKCRNMLLSGYAPANVKQYIRQLGWPLIVLTGIYLLSVVISGDRGPLISLGLLMFSGYFFVTKKKLSLKYALILLFAGASIITMLGIARTLNKRLSFVEKVKKSINAPESNISSSFSPQTEELAGSVRTLNVAVNYIPDKHNFLYGRFQFQQLTAVIPFFSTFMPLIFKERSYKYKSSASFVTWIGQGDNPTSGAGTSVMTDFYFDFGLLGVILGMFIFGYLMRFAEVKMYQGEMPGLFIHTFLIVYLCFAIYISRSTLLFNLKTAVWVCLILLLNKHFLQRRISY